MGLTEFINKIRKQTKGHSLLVSWWEFEVRDKDGKIIQRVRQPTQSLIMNAIDILRVEWFYASGYSMRDISGGYTNEQYVTGAMITGSTGVTGIVVGTGGTTPSITDYKLGTKIAHGSGTGQLLYTTNVFVPTVIDGSTAYFSIAQPLTNNSGGSIAFNEAGIYVRLYSNYYCIERAYVNPAVTIPTGGSATVNYHLGVQLTV